MRNIIIAFIVTIAAIVATQVGAYAQAGCDIYTGLGPHCGEDVNTCGANCPDGSTFTKTVTRCDQFLCGPITYHCDVSADYRRCAVTQPRPACNTCVIETNVGPYIGTCAGPPPTPGGD